MHPASLSLSLTSLTILASSLILSSANVIRPRTTITNGFTYSSCQSAYDFLDASLGFSQVDNSTSMTVELCTSKCTSAYEFAGIYGSQCFCGQKFIAFSPSGQDVECNTPCPGNSAEICGGYHNVSRGSEWWSLYKKSSPDSSSSSSSATSSSTSSVGYTTSTVFTTKVYTVTSCSATITSCHPRLTTETIILSTTVCPITTTPSPTSSTSAVVVTTPVSSTNTGTKPSSTSVSSNGTVKATNTPTATTVPGSASSLGVEQFGLIVSLIGLLALW